jgi:hypothetical protein
MEEKVQRDEVEGGKIFLPNRKLLTSRESLSE